MLQSDRKNNYLLVNSVEKNEALLRTAKVLLGSGVIALPTDTVYGLAALATDSEAIKRIYEIKGRHEAKPLAICVGDIDDIFWCCRVTCSRELLHLLLPGALTLVFERFAPGEQSESSDFIPLSPELNRHSGTSKIGVRVPDSDFIRDLCRTCATLQRVSGVDSRTRPASSVALALTSANSSGEPATLAPAEFVALWPQLDLVCDAGSILTPTSPCPPNSAVDGTAAGGDQSRAGSTVLDLTGHRVYRVIREGCDLDRVAPILASYGYTKL